MRRALVAASFAAVMCASTAHALDKQRPAHGTDTHAEEDTEFSVTGALMLGTALINNSYAARPDNTGLTLMRYAGHADIDILGRALSIPIDINMFSDKQLDGIDKFRPSELDIIAGVTSTHSVTTWNDLELGARYERDMPVDRGNFTQSYADARARLIYSFGELAPDLRSSLAGGDIAGWATLGWFIYNPSYAARPDNTGNALFRYAFHAEISVWDSHAALGLDTTFFTDRHAQALRPSEIDFTPELIGRFERYELHLAYERDMPIDRGNFVQAFVYALLVVAIP